MAMARTSTGAVMVLLAQSGLLVELPQLQVLIYATCKAYSLSVSESNWKAGDSSSELRALSLLQL